MHKSLRNISLPGFAGLALLLWVNTAQSSTTDAAIFAGLWQFPHRMVWIEIDSDGSAFQCRIAPDDAVILSKGVLSPPDKIVWEQVWGEDTLTLEKDVLSVAGTYGEFEFVRATVPMRENCRPGE